MLLPLLLLLLLLRSRLRERLRSRLDRLCLLRSLDLRLSLLRDLSRLLCVLEAVRSSFFERFESGERLLDRLPDLPLELERFL